MLAENQKVISTTRCASERSVCCSLHCPKSSPPLTVQTIFVGERSQSDEDGAIYALSMAELALKGYLMDEHARRFFFPAGAPPITRRDVFRRAQSILLHHTKPAPDTIHKKIWEYEEARISLQLQKKFWESVFATMSQQHLLQPPTHQKQLQ